MCYFRFGDYEFRLIDSRYELKNWSFITTLIPIKVRERAKDGGGLPDFDAIKQQKYPQNLLYNIKHIAKNAEYYMGERMMRMVFCYGEAAAFARGLKRNGIDLIKLAKSIRGKPSSNLRLGKNLQNDRHCGSDRPVPLQRLRRLPDQRYSLFLFP